MPKREENRGFSLRSLGQKARDIIDTAKKRMHHDEDGEEVVLPNKKETEEVLMHISTASVLKASLCVLAIYAAVQLVSTLTEPIFLLILAMFVATVMDTSVQRMEQWKIPRGVAVLLHYLIAIILVFLLLVSLIPTIAEEISNFVQFLSIKISENINSTGIAIPFLPESINAQIIDVWRSALQDPSLDKTLLQLSNYANTLQNIAENVGTFATQIGVSIVRFIVKTIIVLVLAFFMQVEKESLIDWTQSFIPRRYRNYVRTKGHAIHVKIGQWSRGILLLALSIFALTFIALSIVGMPYALTLALLAGFCEMIPVIGPLIAAIPAILIAIAVKKSILWAIVIACLYYAIQWSENNLLVPLIMRRAVGLSPIAILFAILVASYIPGVPPILAVILAIPVTTIISLFLRDWQVSDTK